MYNGIGPYTIRSDIHFNLITREIFRRGAVYCFKEALLQNEYLYDVICMHREVAEIAIKTMPYQCILIVFDGLTVSIAYFAKTLKIIST